MFAYIELAIQQRITDKIAEIRDVMIRKGTRGMLVTPAVSVSVEQGTFEKQGQSTFKVPTDVYVELEFKNLRNEEDRRKGAYPIFLAIIQYLMLQTFALSIDPLKPVKWGSATEKEDRATGVLRLMIIFRTGFTITKVDDEVVTSLLKIGIDYFLKPGDDVKDASDTVTLQGA